MDQTRKFERIRMGGTDRTHQRERQMQKRVGDLENRLNKRTVQFNNFLAKNAKLRDEIDHSRKVWTIFEGEYRKLEGNLAELKKEMGELIEASSAAYESRY